MYYNLEYFFKENSWVNTLQINVKISSYTSFKCMGIASYVFKVANIKELKKIIRFCYQSKINYFILGNGTNSIFTDQGLKCLVLILDGEFKEIAKDKNCLRIGAGVSSTGLASYLKKNNLGGGEFLIGIPATVGGLIFMNAGANGSETKDLVLEVVSIDSKGNGIRRKPPELKLSYRSSVFMELAKIREEREIIIQVTFQFKVSNSKDIGRKQSEILSKRKATQPINKSTWGSVFKNHKEGFAAEMIEKCGFKGKSFGKLRVSPKHCNFFENKGDASYQDIESALQTIQQEVVKKFNCFLVPEVRIIDEQGEIIPKFYTS